MVVSEHTFVSQNKFRTQTIAAILPPSYLGKGRAFDGL
jgi:hypothetical protein